MSYGVGIIIPKCDLLKKNIRFDFCEWTLPITVKIYPNICKEEFKKWINEFNFNQTTTLDKLKIAPCDCVCIIDQEGNFETLANRTPINGQKIKNLKKYLTT